MFNIIMYIILFSIVITYFNYNSKPNTFYKHIKTGDIYVEKNGLAKRVKIINMYYDKNTKQDIVEYVYIDDDNNSISEKLNKTLYNFIEFIK